MSATPRTDAVFKNTAKVGSRFNVNDWIDAERLSRQLETELIALQEENDKLLATVEGLKEAVLSVVCSYTNKEIDAEIKNGNACRAGGEISWASLKILRNALQSLPPTNLVKRSVLENLFTSINKLKSCLESDGIRVQSDNLPMDLEFGASCSGVDEAIKEAHEELQRTRPLWAS